MVKKRTKAEREAEAEKKKEEEWRHYPVEVYQETAKGMVHFSFKTVNSNISGGGVRLGAEDTLDLPYVSVRSFMGRGIQISPDYTKNAGKTANIAKQIRAVLAGEQPKTAENPEIIRDTCLSAFTPRLESNCEAVSPRMRQLLIPKGDSYISFSPVGAVGLNAIVNARVREHNENRDKDRHSWIGQAQFGIGGANPQNVGGLVREMQRPLYFEGPTESREIKKVFSIYYKGISLTPPRELALAYRVWREQAKARNEGRMLTDMRTRQREESYVRRITSAVLGRGRGALGVLEANIHSLPGNGDPLLSEKVDPVIRGVIDPALRDKDWIYRFSWEIANRLAGYKFHDDQGGLGLDDGAVAQIAKWIEEGLR